MNIDLKGSSILPFQVYDFTLYAILCRSGRILIQPEPTRISNLFLDVVISKKHYATLISLKSYTDKVEYFWKKINLALPREQRFIRNEHYLDTAKWNLCSQEDFHAFLKSITLYCRFSRLELTVQSRITSLRDQCEPRIEELDMSGNISDFFEIHGILIDIFERILQKVGPKGGYPGISQWARTITRIEDVVQVKNCVIRPTTTEFNIEADCASAREILSSQKDIRKFLLRHHFDESIAKEIFAYDLSK